MAGRLVHVNGVQPHHLQGLVYMLEASGVCSELCVAEGFGVGSDRHSKPLTLPPFPWSVHNAMAGHDTVAWPQRITRTQCGFNIYKLYY